MYNSNVISFHLVWNIQSRSCYTLHIWLYKRTEKAIKIEVDNTETQEINWAQKTISKVWCQFYL